MSSPTVAAANPPRFEGIGSRVVQESVSGSYISFVLRLVSQPPTLPPITYNFPLTTAEAKCSLAVGIGDFSVHAWLPGSYAQLLCDTPDSSTPPTAYKIPLIKLAVNAPLALGIGGPSCHLLVDGS